MELSFLFSAIRKRPWIIVVFVALGIAAATLAGSSAASYEAGAVLLIQQPTNASGGGGADANRYLQSQVSALKSLDLAEAVATSMGSGFTRQLVESSVRIAEHAGTDVVDVFATADDAPTAERLANSYVDIYLADLEQRADDVSQDDLEEIDARLATFKEQLEEAGNQVAFAKDAYINEALARLNAGVTQIPAIDPGTLIPGAAPYQVSYDTLLQQYSQLLETKTQLEAASRTRVATEVIQRAVEPTEPVSSNRALLIVAGGLTGAVVGLAITVLAARFSRRLVDDVQVAQVLGHSIVGTIGRHATLGKPLPELLKASEYPDLNVIDELCVRAEANARKPGSVTIVVVGTEQAAGATTIATAIAGQFGRLGTQTLLIDADPRRAGITDGFRATSEGGIPAMLATAPSSSLVTGRRTGDQVRVYRTIVTQTGLPEVTVLGRGDKSGAPTLRRSDAATLLERALDFAPVVVVDAGALLDAASTVELCRLADAVVLAIPTQRQLSSQLEVVARQLGRRQGELLPVSTRPRQHRDQLAAPVTIDTDSPVSVETDLG